MWSDTIEWIAAGLALVAVTVWLVEVVKVI